MIDLLVLCMLTEGPVVRSARVGIAETAAVRAKNAKTMAASFMGDVVDRVCFLGAV